MPQNMSLTRYLLSVLSSLTTVNFTLPVLPGRICWIKNCWSLHNANNQYSLLIMLSAFPLKTLHSLRRQSLRRLHYLCLKSPDWHNPAAFRCDSGAWPGLHFSPPLRLILLLHELYLGILP